MPAPKSGTTDGFLAKALPAITVAVALGELAAAYFLLFVPKIAPILKGGKLDPSQLEATVSDNKAYLSKLKGALADYTSFNAEKRQKAMLLVPTEPDIPGIYVQLDTIASAHEFLVSSVDVVPGESGSMERTLKGLRISANVTGGDYDQFKLFLGDLQRSSRLFDVQSVVFSPEGGSFGLVMRAYYLDKQEVIAPTVAPTSTGAKTEESP
jgi:hypothetical protein